MPAGVSHKRLGWAAWTTTRSRMEADSRITVCGPALDVWGSTAVVQCGPGSDTIFTYGTICLQLRTSSCAGQATQFLPLFLLRC
jgi:hypothetical protein